MISQLEAAAAALVGAEHDTVKQGIQQQILEHRKIIRADKPLGQRYDGCKDALTRAQRRLAQAKEAQELAAKAVSAAEKEVKQLTAELADLEALVATAKDKETDCKPKAPIEALQESMQAAIHQLQQLDGVDASVPEEATKQSDILLKRFEATMQEAQKRANLLRAEGPRHRHSSKGPPVLGEDAPRDPPWRLQGKQTMPTYQASLLKYFRASGDSQPYPTSRGRSAGPASREESAPPSHGPIRSKSAVTFREGNDHDAG